MNYGPLNLSMSGIIALSVLAFVLVASIICMCYFSNPFGLPGRIMKLLMTVTVPLTMLVAVVLTVTALTLGNWHDDVSAVAMSVITGFVWAIIVTGAYRALREFYGSW